MTNILFIKKKINHHYNLFISLKNPAEYDFRPMIDVFKSLDSRTRKMAIEHVETIAKQHEHQFLVAKLFKLAIAKTTYNGLERRLNFWISLRHHCNQYVLAFAGISCFVLAGFNRLKSQNMS